jgi:hypothetical protein
LQTQKANTVVAANNLQPIIIQLAVEGADQKASLVAPQIRYNDTVKAATENGCGLGQVINIVTAVLAIVGTANTTGNSLALLTTELPEDFNYINQLLSRTAIEAQILPRTSTSSIRLSLQQLAMSKV